MFNLNGGTVGFGTSISPLGMYASYLLMRSGSFIMAICFLILICIYLLIVVTILCRYIINYRRIVYKRKRLVE
jgi:uncharacterized SAM-binding protein YcdF (DUF218 family)